MRDAIRRGLWLPATAVLLLAAALPGLAQKEKKVEKRPPEDRPRFEKVTPVGELLEHARWVRGTAFTADSKLLITASADHQLRAWNVATGKPHGEPMIAPHSINCLALSPGGTLALVGCGDYENAHGEAQVWDVDAGELLATLDTEGPVWGVAFSDDGKLLTGTYHPANMTSAAQLWEWNQPKPRHLFDIPHADPIWTVALSRDGKIAATGGTDHTLRLWDTAGGKLIGEPRPLPYKIQCVAFAPGGKRVLAACGAEAKGGEERKGGEVHVWAVEKTKPVDKIVYPDDIQAAIFSPNHKYILTGDSERTAQLWDATKANTRVCERIACPVSVLSLAYSPDGQYIAVGGATSTTKTGAGAAQIFRLPTKLWDVGERRVFPVRRGGARK